MENRIALSLDELERIPAWVPALTRAGASIRGEVEDDEHGG